MKHILFASAEKKIVITDDLVGGPNNRVIFLYTPEYLFYLKFAQAEFTPCLKCQKDIAEHWTKVSIIDSGVQFALYGTTGNRMFESSGLQLADKEHHDCYDFRFIPCEKCQKELQEILDTAGLIFGNSEYTPTIRFERRWDFDPQKPCAEVVKRPNNAYVDEKCVLCGNEFDAALDYIYELKDLSGAYLCYDCGKRQEKGNK